MRNLHNRPVYSVDATDVLDCQAPAIHRIGSEYHSHWACGQHRAEILAAVWDEEPNLIVHDIDPDGHVCGQMDHAEAVSS